MSVYSNARVAHSELTLATWTEEEKRWSFVNLPLPRFSF